MSDFIELVQENLMKLVEIQSKKKFEILFVERAEESQSLLIHCKDKCSLDLEGKDLLIFLLEQPESYRKEQGGV
jgi:hypothetical protein